MNRINCTIERLENRTLLDRLPGPTSAVIGDWLFFVEASSDFAGGSGLFKSRLDGSDKTLLKHWQAGSDLAPTWLTAFHNTLFFAADWERTSYSGQELWKSDGTPEGTIMVRDLYGGAQGSNPHDFVIVNDHLLFFARSTSTYEQIFVTDGTYDGTVQLINPPYGTGGYYDSFSHLHITANQLYAEINNYWGEQTERWQTDGTVAGTRIADPFGLIQDDVLRIFGTDSKENMQLDSAGGSTTLRINGAFQTFDNSAFTGILLNGLRGDDSISLGDDVPHAATINGNGSNDTIVGGGGDDQIEGGEGDDVIDGGAGDDAIDAGGGGFRDELEEEENTVRGGAGNDTITGDGFFAGDAGDDHIEGGYADNVIGGGDGSDTLDGGYGNDTLLGGGGDDTLIGGGVWFIEENDSLVGGAGDDSLFAEFGDDTLVGDSGADTLNGGPGVDSIVSDADDTVLDLPSAAVYRGMLVVSGTRGDDVVGLLHVDGTLRAVINGDVTDLAVSSFNYIRIDGGDGNDSISIEPKIQTTTTYIFGGPGSDQIRSNALGNSLSGGRGDDTIVGGDRRDFIDGGLGSDSLDGGDNDKGPYSGDYLVYERRSDRLIKTEPAEMKIRTSVGETDSYDGFEVLQCGSGDDYIVIDNPLDGITTISGGAGNDTLTLHVHYLQASGTALAGIDGGSGDDTMAISITDAPYPGIAGYGGGSGNDRFLVEDIGTYRNFYGGAGTDTVDYSGIAYEPGIIVRIDGSGGDGPLGGDNVDRDVEIVIGTAGDDTLVGGYYDETLIGGDGDDSIVGNQGDDSLAGGSGDDTLRGGEGDDTLVGGGGSDSLDGGPGRNTIIRSPRRVIELLEPLGTGLLAL